MMIHDIGTTSSGTRRFFDLGRKFRIRDADTLTSSPDVVDYSCPGIVPDQVERIER